MFFTNRLFSLGFFFFFDTKALASKETAKTQQWEVQRGGLKAMSTTVFRPLRVHSSPGKNRVEEL